MSRIERKKLEKKAKKSKFSFFKKKNDINEIEPKIEPKTEKKEEIQEKSKPEIRIKKQEDSSHMKTADKIISVEDERRYLERKKANKDLGKYDRDVLTVNDIHTAEDVEIEVPKEKEVEKVEIPKEPDITEIKKINIKEASFEEVKKLSEKKLALQKLERQRRAQEEERIQKQKEEHIEKLRRELEKNKRKKEEKKVEEKKKLETETPKQAEQVEEPIVKEEPEQVEEPKIEEPKVEEVVVVEELVEEEPKKDGIIKRFFKKLFKLIAVLIILAYGVGCVVFYNRFLPNTTINGINAEFKTPKQIDMLAAEKLDGYTLKLKGRNNVEDTLAGNSVDLKYVADGASKKLKEEQGFLTWPLAYLGKEDINGKLTIEFNKNKLDEKVSQFNIFKENNIKEPTNAYPRFDEEKNDYVVDPGDLGSKPIKQKVIYFVEDSLRREATEAELPNNAYVAQAHDANDKSIQAAIGILKDYTRHKIVYDFRYEKYTLGGTDISKMFDIDQNNGYAVKLNKDKVREVVRSLSRKYSTYGDPREIPSASTGGKLKVTGGIYGWLIDREKETDALYDLVKEKKDVENREPIYAQTAISKDKNDMGNEFIEIDLTKQHMWFVRDGEALVSTPIVTGQPNKGDATPPGIYPISYKTRNAVLRGPGYASPVQYWIPFNSSIGIHDAYWQPIYGGNRYTYAGSHGCINTPLGPVSEIYKYAKKGMPVVVHY